MHAGLITLVAFAIASLIMHVIAGMSWASYVSDSIALKDNIGILILMLGIALISAVIAGIAPALYSTAQPAALVLKGSYAMSVKGKMLRNVLVSLQFVLSFIFILMALYVHVQTKFMMSKDMGFPQENILQVWCGYYAGAAHEPLKDKLLQNPSITDVTFSDNLIVSDQKMGWGRTGDDGKQIFMEVLPVTDDFVRFFNLQIIDGRDFRESDNQSETGVFIANETFINMFPQYHVGSQVGGHVDNTPIVGIMKDFHPGRMSDPIKGAFFIYNENLDFHSPWTSFEYLVETEPGCEEDARQFIIETKKELFDMGEMKVRRLSDDLKNQYREDRRTARIFFTFAFLAIVVTCLGVLGLMMFDVRRRYREIALRKVNGATFLDIALLLSRRYLIILAVAAAVSIPVSLIGLHQLITRYYTIHATIAWWIPLVSIAIVLLLCALTLWQQVWKATRIKPYEVLKEN